jgi:hypothetical protein
VPDEMKAGYGREFVPEWCALSTSPPGCALNSQDFVDRKCNVTQYSPYCMELYGLDAARKLCPSLCVLCMSRVLVLLCADHFALCTKQWIPVCCNSR